ncbi:MAG: helix-turn-helix domain-containing protein [Synergistaceae bacterium]|nr:helix-turn-helix domain-containing protein [Synergistaceae bacterium]
MAETEWLTVPEAAEILQVAQQRIRFLLKRKRLNGVKRGRDWLIERSSIEEYDRQRSKGEEE